MHTCLLSKIYEIVQNYHCDERHQVHIPGSCIIFETLVIIFYLFNFNNIDRKRLYCCLSGQNLYCLIIPPVSQYQHLLYVTPTSVQYLYCTVYVQLFVFSFVSFHTVQMQLLLYLCTSHYILFYTCQCAYILYYLLLLQYDSHIDNTFLTYN